MQPPAGGVQPVSFFRRAGHTVVATIVVIIAVELRRGLFISFTSLGTLAAVVVLGLAVWLRHSRAVAASLILLSLAIFLRVFYGGFYDYLRIWPRSLGFLSILWLPVFAIALLFDAATSSRSWSQFRPATAVTAAATLIFLHMPGADTSTAYDGSTPAFVVAGGYVLLVTFVRPAGAWTESVYCVLEPLLLVSITWAAAWCFPYGWYERPAISDLLRYFLPAFALPTAIAVVFVRSVRGLWRMPRQTGPRRSESG